MKWVVGLILLAAVAFAAWVWWQKRPAPAPVTSTASYLVAAVKPGTQVASRESHLLSSEHPQTLDEAALKETVRGKVAEASTAFLGGNYEKLVDLMPSWAVKFLGGREIAIMRATKTQEWMHDQAKEWGVEFNAITVDVGAPLDIVRSGSDLMVVAPYAFVFHGPGGRVLLKMFALAISEDQGKTWLLFTIGDKAQVMQIWPNLPEQLKLPERQDPVFEKD